MAGTERWGAARSQGRWPTRLLNDIPATTTGKLKRAAALAGATRDSIYIGARYDPGRPLARGRSPDRAGRAVQPGLRGRWSRQRVPGRGAPDHRPTKERQRRGRRYAAPDRRTAPAVVATEAVRAPWHLALEEAFSGPPGLHPVQKAPNPMALATYVAVDRAPALAGAVRDSIHL